MYCNESDAFGLSSSEPGRWALVTKKGGVPFVSISFVETLGGDAAHALLTNDMELVKTALRCASQREKIKAIQLVFSCDFPDNQGVGVSDVYRISEGRTKTGVVYHSFHTRFGVRRIGGPDILMGNEVEMQSTVLYERNTPPRRYWG